MSDIIQKHWDFCHTLRHGGAAFPQPAVRKKIAQRFIAGLLVVNQNESRRDGRDMWNKIWNDFFRPSGAWTSLRPQPTVETVGYCRSSLAGLRNPYSSMSSVVHTKIVFSTTRGGVLLA